MKTIEYFTPEPVILAHRGDSARFPENTMPAFESAVEMGVDVIETDVHLSKDGKVVIWHDDTLKRISGDNRMISQLTWEEIKEVNAGSLFTKDNGKTFPFKNKNIKPVLLMDLLIKFPNVKFNVDLKDNNLQLAEKYAGILSSQNSCNRVVTASFNKDVLKHFRKLLPEAITSCTSAEVIKLLFLYRIGLLCIPLTYKKRILQIPEYSGSFKVITRGFVKCLHNRGFRIQVWTVNKLPDMKRFLDMGIDGIFTDKPALLIECIKNRLKNENDTLQNSSDL